MTRPVQGEEEKDNQANDEKLDREQIPISQLFYDVRERNIHINPTFSQLKTSLCVTKLQ
jgi:hypothetical protein